MWSLIVLPYLVFVTEVSHVVSHSTVIFGVCYSNVTFGQC